MIKLKSRYPVPQTLKSSKVNKTKKKIAELVKSGEKLKSKDFEAHWQWGKGDVKKALWEHHHGKCCYCERKRDPKMEPDVEHFRPKAGVKEENNHPGYWWLAYDWNNYLFSCKLCNTAKGTQFPLLPDGKRAFNEDDDLSKEKQALVHPIDDNPQELIGFEWEESGGILVKAVGLDEEGRGRQTVKTLKKAINDKEVMKQRAEVITTLQFAKVTMTLAKRANDQDEIDRISDHIKLETAAKKEFAGFRRAYFEAAGLGEFVATD